MPKWFVFSVAIVGLNAIAVIGTTVVSKSLASEQTPLPIASGVNESGDYESSDSVSSGTSVMVAPIAEPIAEPIVTPEAKSNSTSPATIVRTDAGQSQPAAQSAANIPIPDELKVPSLGDPTQDPFFQELQALVSEQNTGLLSQSSPLDEETSQKTREQCEEYFARLRDRLEIVSHLTAAAQGLTVEAERQAKSPVDASKAADTLRQIMQLREMIGKLVTQEL